MKYVRAELHNHSTHSDGGLSVEELVAYAAEKDFGVLALTDHNTVSGHGQAYEAIRRKGCELSLLAGVEVTTFYGHILALGQDRMVDFTLLDPSRPEPFLYSLRAAGAWALGIAHPFCVGRPVMAGCRFAMTIRNPELFDYIEVVNTAAGDTFSGNARALAWWEELVLGGCRIAAVSGKDIHKRPCDLPVFTTYACVEEDSGTTDAEAVLGAVLSQKTMLSKGPLFQTECFRGMLTVTFDNSSSYLNWNARWNQISGVLEIKDSTGQTQSVKTDFRGPVTAELPTDAKSAVVKLYEGECSFEHLLAVGAPVYCAGEESV